ncbi:CRISPR-associated protein Csx19 [Microbispora sp. NPDC049125]|uniref:type III-D CRISPR-associated protein Csx19 n=1 Tax=Microbispora sp. NPDC049125 TaxID=3154929 RepID=UPI00346537D9
MTTLYGVAGSGVTLSEALEAGRMDGGCALLTAPSAYHVTRVMGRDCVTSAGHVDLSTVYEARAFTPDVEMRWVEAGYVVFLAEDAGLLPASMGDRVEPLDAIDVIEARYLVWGRVKAADQGWATLASARIGTLAVPALTTTPGGRVRLVAREYVVHDHEHGNAYVAEERLLGFEPYEVEGAA